MTDLLIETKVLNAEQAASATMLEIHRKIEKVGVSAVLNAYDMVMQLTPDEAGE